MGANIYPFLLSWDNPNLVLLTYKGKKPEILKTEIKSWLLTYWQENMRTNVVFDFQSIYHKLSFFVHISVCGLKVISNIIFVTSYKEPGNSLWTFFKDIFLLIGYKGQ